MWTDVLMDLFTKIVVPVFGTLVMTFIVPLIFKFMKKYGITVSDTEKSYIESHAESIVMSVEEEAANLIKTTRTSSTIAKSILRIVSICCLFCGYLFKA